MRPLSVVAAAGATGELRMAGAGVLLCLGKQEAAVAQSLDLPTQLKVSSTGSFLASSCKSTSSQQVPTENVGCRDSYPLIPLLTVYEASIDNQQALMKPACRPVYHAVLTVLSAAAQTCCSHVVLMPLRLRLVLRRQWKSQ